MCGDGLISQAQSVDGMRACIVLGARLGEVKTGLQIVRGQLLHCTLCICVARDN